jgi:tryptophan 2,3-dioxygenase
MDITTPIQEKIEQLNEKFAAINQKTETHLEGLLWSKPITDWD